MRLSNFAVAQAGTARMDSEDCLYDSGDLAQQSFHDAQPFRVERFPAYGLARPTIPISCVALIPFFAVEVGVSPRTLGAFVPLSRFVRPLPVALGVPPQSCEGVCESGWRLVRAERLTKIVEGHVGYP
jgi:hypothetical protein